jgi:hypothetical protein
MRFRKLRIAWSVACGIACVLLVVLWVRSYWWVDSIETRKTPTFWVVASSRGALGVGYNPLVYPVADRDWKFESYSPDYNEQMPVHSFLGFYIHHLQGEAAIVVPHWSLVLFTAVIAPLPWIRWSTQFSLRTLLIATTLVAVVLGLLVYFVCEFAAPAAILRGSSASCWAGN